jgi:4-amino-4-deoxy-L-arabinose transferase-like glycosyltransferase
MAAPPREFFFVQPSPETFMPHDADITSAQCAAASIDDSAAQMRHSAFPISLPAWLSSATASAKLRATTIALLLCFLLPGLVGHDPWKQDEAYVFGMVLEILRGGDWVVPLLAGEPFMEKPPLYYLAAALTAKVASPLLALHDGARLASGLFTALALLFVGLTARRFFGPGRGTVAVLLLAGTVGLTQHAHEMLPDTALFCGFAVAIYGLAWARERAVKGGFWLGIGVGIGFLSKGLIEPAVIGMTAMALPLVFRTWRSSRYRLALVVAALVALPWLLAWPIALYQRSPDLFLEWFWTNNFGRYFGFAHLGADSEPWYYTRVLPWFTLPVGPLALWAFAKKRRDFAGDPALQLLAALIVATLLVLTTSASARSLYALPLLLPLAIVASSLSGPDFETAARWGARFGVVLFGGAALLLWSLWIYGFGHGHPPQIELLAKLPADYNFSPAWPFLAGALALTGFWVFVVSRRNLSGVHRWTASIAFAWGTAMTLLLPWLDYAKSFRGTFTELAARVPEGECVSSIGLGEPQRGMLDYIVGIRTHREETNAHDCRHLLVQTNYAREVPVVESRKWAFAWQGGRPGERDEIFTLFERRDAAKLHRVRAAGHSYVIARPLD